MSDDQSEIEFPNSSENAFQTEVPKNRKDLGQLNAGAAQLNRRLSRSKNELTVDTPGGDFQPATLFLSDQEVASRYSVSRPTIWRWVRVIVGFPNPVKLAKGTTRWHLKDLEEYENGCDPNSAKKKSDGFLGGVEK